MDSERPDRVLIIDDDPAIRRLLCKLLSRAGYECLEASDGEQGYYRVLEDEPSIVLTDWEMPHLDGVALIERIRATELPWYPYILVVSASDDQAQGLDSGADDFITKPIRPEQVLPRVRAGQRIVTLQDSLRKKNVQLNESIERLAALAVADPMTGLMNRRAFRDAAAREWGRAERYDLPLTCVMIDIDHFKRVNDTFGHATGDAVICRLSDILREQLRDTDIICRYGGEEFCLLLTNTPTEHGTQIAKRLRETVADVEAPEIDDDLNFTVSCGVAARSFNTLSVEALIDHADQALLVAKRTGRDRVVRHDDIELSLSLLSHDVGEAELVENERSESAALIPYHIVNTLLTVLNHRDPSTVLHSQRVARLCTEMGHYLALEPADRLTLEIAALLHDVGKLALPDEILTKTGRLTREEFAISQRHRDVSVDVLDSCFSNRQLIDIVRYSGNAFDGSTGTPAGAEIPLGSRILSIASLYDDVCHGRGWWQEHAPEDALAILAERSATQLDPQLVDSFTAMIRAEIPSNVLGSGAAVDSNSLGDGRL